MAAEQLHHPAPISGTILKKNAEEGSLVNPIAMQGFFSLCEMADLSDLEVELTIQERDISKISKGQKCQGSGRGLSRRVYEGYVSRLMPTADRAKGAIPVRVKVKRARRRRRSLSEAGDGSAGVVPEQVGCVTDATVSAIVVRQAAPY